MKLHNECFRFHHLVSISLSYVISLILWNRLASLGHGIFILKDHCHTVVSPVYVIVYILFYFVKNYKQNTKNLVCFNSSRNKAKLSKDRERLLCYKKSCKNVLSWCPKQNGRQRQVEPTIPWNDSSPSALKNAVSIQCHTGIYIKFFRLIHFENYQKITYNWS